VLVLQNLYQQVLGGREIPNFDVFSSKKVSLVVIADTALRSFSIVQGTSCNALADRERDPTATGRSLCVDRVALADPNDQHKVSIRV